MGGLGIFLKRDLGATSIRFCEVLPGRIACLNFVAEGVKIAFYNVHIFPDDDFTPLLMRLHQHVNANRASEVILAGDWNFEIEENSSSATQTFFMNAFANFSEIRIDSPTYISYSGKAVSRIDRIYFNCCPAVLTLLKASSGVQPRGAPRRAGSDHRALRVSLMLAHELDPKIPPRIYDSPNWMDVSSLYIAQICEPNASAFKLLQRYSTAFMDAALDIQERERRTEQQSGNDFAVATQALWHALAGKIHKSVKLLTKFGCGSPHALHKMSGTQLRRLAEREVSRLMEEQVRSDLRDNQKDIGMVGDDEGLGFPASEDKAFDEKAHLYHRRELILMGYAAWKRQQVYRPLNSLRVGAEIFTESAQIIDHLTDRWQAVFDLEPSCHGESASELLEHAIPF
eukprot:4815157-Amphidinium_carterae.2